MVLSLVIVRVLLELGRQRAYLPLRMNSWGLIAKRQCWSWMHQMIGEILVILIFFFGKVLIVCTFFSWFGIVVILCYAGALMWWGTRSKCLPRRKWPFLQEDTRLSFLMRQTGSLCVHSFPPERNLDHLLFTIVFCPCSCLMVRTM